MPYPEVKEMSLDLEIVDINVSVLIGLDVLDEHKMYVNNIDNEIVFNSPA